MAALPTIQGQAVAIPKPPATPQRRSPAESEHRLSTPKIVSHQRRADQFTPDLSNKKRNDQEESAQDFRPPVIGKRAAAKTPNVKTRGSKAPTSPFPKNAFGMMQEVRHKLDLIQSMESPKNARGSDHGSRPMTSPNGLVTASSPVVGGEGSPSPPVAAQPQLTLQNLINPSAGQLATATAVAASQHQVKFTVPKREVVIKKPPAEAKFSPVFPQGVAVEQDEVSEADKMRKQYNTKAPWDKTPAWRPLTRGGAQMLMDLKAEDLARRQLSPDGKSISSASITSPPRALGSTKASKLVNPAQAKAVELQGKLAQSLSPVRSETSSFGLSDQGSNGEFSPARSQQEVQEEMELFDEETLELKNPAAHRPVGRSLLATHHCGETRNCASPVKQREKAKQFAWNATGSNLGLAINLPQNGRAPDRNTLSQLTSMVESELNNTTGAWSNTGSSTCNSTTPGPFSKHNELDSMSWKIHRRAERRKGHLAAKLVGGTVIPQGRDAQGGSLQYITTHRRFHENE